MFKKKGVIGAVLFAILTVLVFLVARKLLQPGTAESLTERYEYWNEGIEFGLVVPDEYTDEAGDVMSDEFVVLQLPESVNNEAVPPIAYADITIGSIFDVANEVDGILTLGMSLSDDAKMVAQHFIDEGWHFIITELSVSDEDEYLPDIVKRTGSQVYYAIVCEDADYTAVIVDDSIVYEKDVDEE